MLTPTRPCPIVLRPFELRSCGQERGNDIDTMAAEMLLHRVRVLPCVPQEHLHGKTTTNVMTEIKNQDVEEAVHLRKAGAEEG